MKVICKSCTEEYYTDQGHLCRGVTTARRTPSEIPCPKCGSANIYRRYFAQDQNADHFTAAPPKNPLLKRVEYIWISEKDHINNFCRCCQYTWQTVPLGESDENP